MKRDEHNEQVALINWWSLAHYKFNQPEFVLFAIPNGGNRSAITGKILKSEGVRAGVPDLFLAVQKGEFNGLFIEMKKEKGGKVSESQRKMINCLTNNGYKAAVCNGFLEAVDVIEMYMKQ